MSHSHSHDHAARPSSRDRDRRRIGWTLTLVLVYMGAEVAGGLLTNSLALLADAGHMFSDAGSLALALVAIRIAQREPTPSRSFGYHRAEPLAALAHGVTLVLVSAYVFGEAYLRFQDPPQVLAPPMLAIGAGGLAVNVVGLLILEAGRHESLNVRGAWLHVLADAAGSVGTIVAAGLIWWRGWSLADPIASVLIGLLVLGSSAGLLKDAVRILMQHAPAHIDVDEVNFAILSVHGVADVHDLHIWTVTSGRESLSAHVVVDDGRDYPEVLREIKDLLFERFKLDHCAIQLEPHGFPEMRGEL